MDGRGRIASGPQVRAIGLPGDAAKPLEDALDEMADAVEDAVKRLGGEERDDDDALEAAINRTLKRASHRVWGRRPIVETTVLRV
jgi:ribonuclease J